MSKSKSTLVVIETGHLSKIAIAGGDRLMRQMAPYLLKNYSLHIILPHLAKDHWQITHPNLSFDFTPPIYFERFRNRIAFFLTYLLRIIHSLLILRAYKESIILYSSTNTFVDVVPAFLHKSLKTKTCWIARVHHLVRTPSNREGLYLSNAISYLLDRLSLKMIHSADKIFVLNNLLRQELINKYQFPSEKMQIIGGGIDLQAIRKIKPLKNTPSYDAIFVGRLHPTKGIFDLPIIWKIVTNQLPHARLAIIGESSYSKDLRKLKALLKQNHLSTKVILAGYLNFNELIRLLKRSKVFLFTDHEAGWGLAVAEAMACGLPVIGYDTGILGSVFKTGYKTVPVKNFELTAQTITKLLQSNPARRNLAHEAQTEAQNYDWQKTANKFLNFINKL